MQIVTRSVTAVIFLMSAIGSASAQSMEPSESPMALGAADTYFVTQTSLGTPFQVASGRVAESKGTTKSIRDYADLMVSSHITVDNALKAILEKKAATPPPTLLQAAYSSIVSTLQHERGKTFDADYVHGQVLYQKANAALYQYEISNGTDPDLKAFAQATLPKIQDHLERALKLENSAS
jgi:putative membrane protein